MEPGKEDLPVIPALGKWGKEHLGLKAQLDYTASLFEVSPNFMRSLSQTMSPSSTSLFITDI